MRKVIKRHLAVLKIFATYLIGKVVLRKPASILMYHSVADNPEFFTVAPASFERQMSYLHKNNYNVLPLKRLVELIKTGQKIPQKTVAITFDDGYEDNYTKAFPVLKKYGFPATIFLITGRIGNKEYTNKRRLKLPMLDWNQIKEIHNSGIVDLEPHTVSHPRLSELPTDLIEKEILESKKEIGYRLNKECYFFAYPFGDFNKEVFNTAKRIFKALLTVERGFIGQNDNPLKLKRNSIDCFTTDLSFKLKI